MELEERITRLEHELDATRAELHGFKLAFIRLTAFLPLTERDVTAAREFALAQAEDAMVSGDIPDEVALTVFSTIQKTMSLAGEIWRGRWADSQDPDASQLP